MKNKLDKKEYSKLADKASPNSPIVLNCIKAFIVGGIICCIGQLLTNLFKMQGASIDDAGTYTSICLIIIASIFTGMGIYSKLGRFAGAGSIVPITGFSNSVTSPAIEFKTEGWILGLGAKIFLVAGPVILYGTLTSMLVGIIYYLGR